MSRLRRLERLRSELRRRRAVALHQFLWSVALASVSASLLMPLPASAMLVHETSGPLALVRDLFEVRYARLCPQA
jgi:hypothetical protein